MTRGLAMRLEILHVPYCPGVAVLEARLAEVLSESPVIEATQRVVVSAGEAERVGMAGSPTLLVDGVDPFARSDQQGSMSCRLYLDEGGRLGPAPSVGQLRAVLGSHANDVSPKV
jgi:hypothetical protein